MSSSDESDSTPESIKSDALGIAFENLLPEKSKEKYLKAYNDFEKWKNEKGAKSVSEAMLIVYFQHLSSTMKSSSLWVMFSMLRSTISIKHDIQINTYTKLLAFLRRKSDGHQAKKSKVLTKQNVETFLNDAPDHWFLAIKASEQDAQPGPSKTLGRRTSLDSNGSTEHDPLSTAVQQCRFCGEFNRDCIAVSASTPYLAANKTTLALNDTSVQLDFNNQALPNTVCRDCDAKLREIADFIKVVKAAQSTLTNIADEREFGETPIEFEVVKKEAEPETETLVIKTEYDSQYEQSDDEKEDKEGVLDSVTVGETVVVKKSVTRKRKSDTVTANPKKVKAEEFDNELIIDIKEEVVEKEDGEGQTGVSDSDVKPSELELATSALVLEMAGDGTSEYQG